MEHKIGTGTSIGKIIRARPMAVGVLEEAAGHRMWNAQEATLPEFCQALKLDLAGLQATLENVQPAPAGTDWESKPIYHLIDFLTQEHARYQREDLPLLGKLLDAGNPDLSRDRLSCEPLEKSFKAFDQELRMHMEQEETFLFPKIMRNEACFRFRELSPEACKGSVEVELATQIRLAEAVFQRNLAEIQAIAHALDSHHAAGPGLAESEASLEAFGIRLGKHIDLEDRILYPSAGRLEQELFAGSAPGVLWCPGGE